MSDLGDRDVVLEGTHLQGKAIALLVCGSIAAYRAPDLARSLRRQGATVVAFASEEALRYVAIEALAWSCDRPVVTKLTAASEHLSVPGSPSGQGFDAYVVAPATYNAINQFRQGIADDVVTTTLAVALGRLERGQSQILLAPTMHGTFHNRILSASIEQFQRWGVRVIPPRSGQGKHNLPEPDVITVEVCRAVSRSPLRDRAILVTGGPTPVAIDSVREITTRFTGQLGIAIASELHRRGANVTLIHGRGTKHPPAWLPHQTASHYDQYRSLVSEVLGDRPYDYGIFSAAVADYRPATVFPGKVPSDGTLERIELVKTIKVIQEVRHRFPKLGLISFKYEEDVTLEELLAIARTRLDHGHLAVVANRGEEVGPNGEQVAYLVDRENQPQRAVGKGSIALLLADFLASLG